jgi:hypothetical protein
MSVKSDKFVEKKTTGRSSSKKDLEKHYAYESLKDFSRMLRESIEKKK